jgi:hypothetical protein
MSFRFQPITCFVVAAVLLSAVSAYGQRERRREGYDPADMLKRMDDNKNGMIEPSEISGQNRMFIDRAAERANLDKSKAMPIDKLLPAMQAISEEYRKQRDGGRGPGGTPPSNSTLSPASSSPAPVTSSGFEATSGRAGAITSLEARFDPSVIDYVNGTLLREQDTNGDGHIDKTEWAKGKWSSTNPPENSDLNHDGKLSREELCIRISKSRGIPFKGEPTSSSSGPPSGAPPAGLGGSRPSGSPPGASSSSTYGKQGKGDKTASTTKKSYRFLTPTERLPKDMPEWFVKSDADGDGQIMMAEYALSWTEAEAAKFAKYDLNGDGIITPSECLAVEKPK